MSALRSDLQIAPQEIFVSSTTQMTDLGARATTGDGRVFRYALGSGTALVAGKVYQSQPLDTTNFQKLGVGVAAGTGTFVVTTGSSVTLAANLLSAGVLIVRDGLGKGFTYGIKNHAAVAAGTVAITLSDPLQIALDTTSVIDVEPNPYSGVIIAPTTLTGAVVGLAASNIPASNYGWIQTRGIASALIDGTPAAGTSLTPSANTAGSLGLAGGTGCVVATTHVTGVSGKYTPVFLTFE